MIIARVLTGQREAFAGLVDRYKNSVYAICHRYLGEADEARDAAQAAFVKAFEHLGSFDRTQPFAPWLYRIASNGCLDRLRRRSRTTALAEGEAEQVADSAPTPEEAALQQEAVARVRRAVADLPEPYRQLVVLAHFEGKSYNEIVTLTGSSLTIVKNRLYRARLMLKELLTDKGGESCAVQRGQGAPARAVGQR